MIFILKLLYQGAEVPEAELPGLPVELRGGSRAPHLPGDGGEYAGDPHEVRRLLRF